MAINFNGTSVKLPSTQIPSGYSKPAITEFNDAEYKGEFVLSVDRDTVANADKAVTVNNILSDAAVGINKQLTDILTADYINTNDVQAYAEWITLNHNISASASSDFLTNISVAFICKVKLYVKTV